MFITQELTKDLEIINKSILPSKLKIWCLQFGLLPCLMWPLTMYDITLTMVEKMENMVSSYVRKCLGAPQCLSSITLYGQGLLQLPLSSLTEEFKCTKARLEMTLSTGRKWTAKNAVWQAETALYCGDIIGQVQYGRSVFAGVQQVC